MNKLITIFLLFVSFNSNADVVNPTCFSSTSCERIEVSAVPTFSNIDTSVSRVCVADSSNNFIRGFNYSSNFLTLDFLQINPNINMYFRAGTNLIDCSVSARAYNVVFLDFEPPDEKDETNEIKISSISFASGFTLVGFFALLGRVLKSILDTIKYG